MAGCGRAAHGLGGVPTADGIDGRGRGRFGNHRNLSRRFGEFLVLARDPPGPLLLERLIATWPTLTFCLGFFGLSVYTDVLRRQPASLNMLLLSGALLGSSLAFAVGLPVHSAFDGAARWVFAANVQASYLLAWGSGLAWLLLFPTPLLHGSSARRAGLVALLGPLIAWVVSMIVVALAPRAFAADTFAGWMRTSILVQSALTVTTVAGCLALLAVRTRLALAAPPGDVPRQQVLWVAGSALVSGLLTFALWMLPQFLTGSSLLSDDLIGAPGLFMVAGLAVAVTRYRLFDLDVVLGRTLVYAVLVVAAVLLYVGAVGLLTMLVGSRSAMPVLTAVLVALILNPLRVRLELLVDHAFYGERNNPYEALSRLATRISDRTVPLEDIASDIASALRTRYVAIRTDDTTAIFGERHGSGVHDLVLPIRDDEETIGALAVGLRAIGERFSRSERRLLADLASQIGNRVHERRLVGELHDSRERIATAREEERRSLRRTLHDEVGPTMAAIALRAETVRRLLGRREAAAHEADAVLTEISEDASEAARSLRELAYRLRPPGLDEHGLVDALRCYAATVPGVDVRVTSQGADGDPALSPAVQAAAYRIIVAALANVGIHARARVCRVTLTREQHTLKLLVEDDGVGLAPGASRGVGLSGMAERAAELGGTMTLESSREGGLCVRVLLPTERPR